MIINSKIENGEIIECTEDKIIEYDGTVKVIIKDKKYSFNDFPSFPGHHGTCDEENGENLYVTLGYMTLGAETYITISITPYMAYYVFKITYGVKDGLSYIKKINIGTFIKNELAKYIRFNEDDEESKLDLLIRYASNIPMIAENGLIDYLREKITDLLNPIPEQQELISFEQLTSEEKIGTGYPLTFEGKYYKCKREIAIENGVSYPCMWAKIEGNLKKGMTSDEAIRDAIDFQILNYGKYGSAKTLTYKSKKYTYPEIANILGMTLKEFFETYEACGSKQKWIEDNLKGKV